MYLGGGQAGDGEEVDERGGLHGDWPGTGLLSFASGVSNREAGGREEGCGRTGGENVRWLEKKQIFTRRAFPWVYVVMREEPGMIVLPGTTPNIASNAIIGAWEGMGARNGLGY